MNQISGIKLSDAGIFICIKPCLRLIFDILYTWNNRRHRTKGYGQPKLSHTYVLLTDVR